jgi:hypothetical protein
MPDETYAENGMQRVENARSLDVTRVPVRAAMGVGGNISNGQSSTNLAAFPLGGARFRRGAKRKKKG